MPTCQVTVCMPAIRQPDDPLGESRRSDQAGCRASRAGRAEAVLPLSLPPNSSLLFSLALLPAEFPSQAESFHLWAWPQSDILWKLSAEFI